MSPDSPPRRPHPRRRAAAPLIAAALVLVACSGSGGANQTPSSATTAPASTVSASTAGAPTSAPPPTTGAPPATTPPTTSAPPTTVAPRPISIGDLWALDDHAALLAAPGGATYRPALSIFGAKSWTETVGGVDTAAAAASAGYLGGVSFRAEREVDGASPRRVFLQLFARSDGAAAFTATTAPAWDPASAAAAATTAIPGAFAFDYTADDGKTRYALVTVARGPLMAAAEVAHGPDVAPEAARATAEALAQGVLRRIDARLATCGTPCTGVAGGAPAFPARDLAKKTIGTCRNYAEVGADFRPPATYTVEVPCSQPHDIEYVAPLVIDDPAYFRPHPRLDEPRDDALDRATYAAVARCLDLTAAARATRDLDVSWAGEADPSPEQRAAGDNEIACIITARGPGGRKIPPVPA